MAFTPVTTVTAELTIPDDGDKVYIDDSGNVYLTSGLVSTYSVGDTQSTAVAIGSGGDEGKIELSFSTGAPDSSRLKVFTRGDAAMIAAGAALFEEMAYEADIGFTEVEHSAAGSGGTLVLTVTLVPGP